MTSMNLYLLAALSPLFGALLAGFLGRQMGRTGSHTVTIVGVTVSLITSLIIFRDVLGGHVFNGTVYTWALIGDVSFEVGFLIDRLSALMMIVVTSVSLMVHIYTIGYMREDPGYQRFFSYISLFTFAMLMLVMSNNFLQLFFGWEAVGLVSYLLIGFWYKKDSAIYANLKAFLVNRVGDFGFLLGIALVLHYAGSLDYAAVFDQSENLANQQIELFNGVGWSLVTVICICLFVGAMGKSAQFPLHVWLPDSMEGPTPISALIHAATMVTAGIFMVARMSPLFEYSEAALSFVLVIGSITALFMGLLGLVQNDIKRVVAYSTLSQLGYMTVALGVSAYSAAMFHLMTHAFFKALLFLAAGSVIIGMHHQQDMRYMGGLRRKMPITWLVSLIGSLALIGFPFFSGFYSKDSIIEAVHLSTIPGSGFAYAAVLIGVFITALYSFRMYFLVFEGEYRGGSGQHDHAGHQHHDPHESPMVVWMPLVVLAVLSIVSGAISIESILFGGYFDDVIFVLSSHDVVEKFGEHFHGWLAMGLHGFQTLPFWLALGGVFVAWFLFLYSHRARARLSVFAPITRLLEEKYFLDKFNEWCFALGSRSLGGLLWRLGDQKIIDGLLVNGSAKLVGMTGILLRRMQTGFVSHYAFVMILGAFGLVTFWLFGK
ncbi:MAG: NADH-quinone oxidoreductase subunit L [Burkholderiales bacterium]|nr:NADH-quinone oxidoreductase subunit L [Burkholderiales bacterium]OUT76354.1 MAG: NADH-quinone oxidoreductase subunit L [Betaproteobacteria bacterium TMED22]